MAALQVIELTPYVPPPPVIQPSGRFPPSARRLMRTPSLSTITDRRESGTSFESFRPSSSSAASSSSRRSRSVSRGRRRSNSTSSSGSTLSSESQHTQSSSRRELAQVFVHESSPPSSLRMLDPLRTASLPVITPIVQEQDDSPPHAVHSRDKTSPAELPFSPLAPPSTDDLKHAADLTVLSHDGRHVRFGDLFTGQRTIVLFIRHFWCPLCQDYMASVVRAVDPAALDRSNVRLVVLSNGSPSMIKSYRQIFRLPSSVSLLTDPSKAVYNALGMTRRTMDSGPENEKGEYVRHSYWAGIGMVVKHALRTRMPLTANGGDVKQLGGEFILGPGLACSYTSRMVTTRSHTSISVLLDRAGVPLRQPTPEEERVVRAVRSLPARALRPAPNVRREKENASDHGHVSAMRRLVEQGDADAEEDGRRDALRGIQDRRLVRRGGFKHLQWEGDAGLYAASEADDQDHQQEREEVRIASPSRPAFPTSPLPSPAPSPPPPPPGPAYMTADGQALITAHSDRLLTASYAHQERARRISDPGPALVAEWLAGVQA